MSKDQKQPEIIEKYYTYLKWITQRVAKFPRNQRYTLGEKIEETAFEVLKNLIEAYYSKEKIGILRKANLNLEILRFFIRLAKDLALLSNKQYEFSATSLVEIGQQIGGWIKQQLNK
jgi:four helix bundle protein